jgi:Ser/Thr protein kinase RdoA (MazF antagonist)
MTVTEWHLKVVNDAGAILKDLQKYYHLLSLTKVPVKSWNAIFRALGEDKDYCVKVINEETSGIRRTLQDLSYVAEVMHALQVAGFFHVLPPLRSRRGKYVHRCGGYWSIVYHWAPFFAQFGLSEDQVQTVQVAERAARLLSEMHCSAQGSMQRLTSPKDRDLPQAYKPSVWAAEADTLWIAAERNLCQRKSSVEAIEKLHIARELGEKLVEDNSWFFVYTPENEIVIHGDFRPENVLLGPGDFSLIFDFDFAHHSYPEVDVAHGALNFAGPRWLIGPRDWRVCSRFLRAYREVSGGIEISWERLDLTLRWSVIKALSLSFKEEQVFGRLRLYYDILKNLRLIRE